ncbi:MAG: ribosomal protein S18-alanine N-acetyltransferase [Methanospirillum sp.]|uniref:ribosomal protein S18-alanine N-acetyltransferase n=1 Tax=Methanospirillum sp. TaxID=45200 RepID=UPI002371E780|nr:ribosomal protein S18-alanine N-acetyltransferase [Methanospirillum sp.]MDD1730116.1 ribosomal protein S18-alanine N-acetyltransferase [Methanospirillum sp.]
MEARSLQIRRMKEADIPAVELIERNSFTDSWSRETLEDALETFPDTNFIAESHDGIAGFIICGVEDTGEEIYGHICSLAVAKRHQGSGIGSALVQRAEYQVMLKGATAMQLEVRISNQKAQQFYKKNGYEPVFHYAGYYANTEDAIIMMRWFRY